MPSTISADQKQKLEALLDRLIEEQKQMLLNAAEMGLNPTDIGLGKIANIELTIAATESLLDS